MIYFLTLEWKFLGNYYIKCHTQITHSAPENLCTQSPPLTLSLSQIIELEEEAEDEPKLFTWNNKKQYKKTTFLACQKAYIK